MGTPFACAFPASICGTTATTFNLDYTLIAGDGVNPATVAGAGFTYDVTQTPAANLAAVKAAVAADASGLGIAVPAATVLVFLGVN